VDKQLFPLGQVVATRNVLKALTKAGVDPAQLLARHQSGDWGQVCAADARENERSLRHGWRVLSNYTLRTGAKVWLLIESDRSVTTILKPEDY
jgi:hypothetical protein